MRAHSPTLQARERVRALMPVEGALAFRRRCETILEWLDPAPGTLLLDCGCGCGFTLRMLAELTDARLVGLDHDAGRIEKVRQDFADVSNLCLVAGDAQQLPFADGSFDHIVCSEVIEHVPDDAQVVREMARVLKPGGQLAITVPCADFPFSWDPPNWLLKRLGGRQLRGERLWSGIWYGHRRLYHVDELANLVAESGLEIIDQRSLTVRTPPFAHLLLYGIGKPLLNWNLLPAIVRDQAGRTGPTGSAPPWSMRWVMRAFNAIDAPNDDPMRVARANEFVAIALLARRPDGSSIARDRDGHS